MCSEIVSFPTKPEKRLEIGCSLPFRLLTEPSDTDSTGLSAAFGSREILLSEIARYADTVELRSVGAGCAPETVLSAARLLKNAGLGCTVHASLADISPENFFAPYTLLFSSGLQGSYCLTVHPLPDTDDTVRVLRALCRYAEERGYPVTLALENQRFSAPEKRKTGSCRAVSAIAAAVDSPVLVTCFDFGHQYSNIRKFGADADTVDGDFLSRAGHTHIHALYEGTTHFPLTMGETALEENLTGLLKNGYSGILSLELEAQRFTGIAEYRSAYLDSLRMLRTAEGCVRRKLAAQAWYRDSYPAAIRAGLAELDKKSSAVLPLAPALYLLSVGGKRIAVDPALWSLPLSEEGIDVLLEALGTADAVILTHGHIDHCDPAFLKRLRDRIPRFYVPDFLADTLTADGTLRPETVISVRAGERLDYDGVTLTFFESPHVGVPEYGFAVSYDGKTLLFPTDIRSYEQAVGELPRFGHPILFAHVWLVRVQSMNPARYEEQLAPYRAFLASTGAERILFGHLYDVRRTASDMWTDQHTDAITEGQALSSELLLPGTVYEL